MGLAHSEGEVDRLRAQLASAWLEIERLNRVVEDQAKALANVTDDVPNHAPTLATLYWLWAPTRWHEPHWSTAWNRIVPLIDALGDLKAMKLTPLVWEEHRARRRQAGLKDITLNVELMRAKELLRWAVNHRLIKYSPLASAKGEKVLLHRETWLKPEQIEKLLIAAEDVVDDRLAEGDDDGFRAKVLRACILCWHDAMMRVGESLSIRRDRIGGDGRVQLYASETKGRKQRTVFLTPRTLEAIEAIPVDPGSPFVFSRDGKRLHERTVHYWWAKAREKAGVDMYVAPGEQRVRRHDIRASGASTADEAGARATAVRDTLGHRHLATTEKYLRSEQAENARHAAEKMVEATERFGPKKARRAGTSRGNRTNLGRFS